MEGPVCLIVNQTTDEPQVPLWHPLYLIWEQHDFGPCGWIDQVDELSRQLLDLPPPFPREGDQSDERIPSNNMTNPDTVGSQYSITTHPFQSV
jgi:hypothetical protein